MVGRPCSAAPERAAECLPAIDDVQQRPRFNSGHEAAPCIWRLKFLLSRPRSATTRALLPDAVKVRSNRLQGAARQDGGNERYDAALDASAGRVELGRFRAGRRTGPIEPADAGTGHRSDEHTSELQSLMRI